LFAYCIGYNNSIRTAKIEKCFYDKLQKKLKTIVWNYRGYQYNKKNLIRRNNGKN